jgi:hypothetical protein
MGMKSTVVSGATLPGNPANNQPICYFQVAKINFWPRRIIFPDKAHILLHPALFVTLPSARQPPGFYRG